MKTTVKKVLNNNLETSIPILLHNIVVPNFVWMDMGRLTLDKVQKVVE